MKSLLTALLVFLFVSSGTLKSQTVFSFSPEKPKIGDEIKLIYDSDAPTSALPRPHSVTAQILIYRNDDSPLYLEVPLTSDGQLWKGSFTLKEEKGNYLVFRFGGDDKKDENNGNLWDALVYDDKGNPVKNAHLSRANFIMAGGFNDFIRTKDQDMAQKEAAEEKKLYPANVQASFALWNIEMKDENKEAVKANIKKELDEAYSQNKSDESLVSNFVNWYKKIDDTVTAKKIGDDAVKESPHGKFAQDVRARAVWNESDPEKRIALIESFGKDFPDCSKNFLPRIDDLLYMKSSVVRLYSTQKEYEKAESYMEKNDLQDAGLYNSMAWPLIEKGEQLEKATAWAKKGVELAGKVDLSKKPSYMSDDAYRQQITSEKTMVLDTYGYGLVQKGDYDEAVKTLEEAYTLGKGEDNDMNTHYVSALIKAGKNDKAKEIALECIKTGKSSDDMVADFRAFYTKQNGSDKGFDELITETRKPLLEKMKQDILTSRMKDKPEIDFTLKDINNKSYTLASFKGKVVVIDFWATWCGPCKASFPHLQKVYNKFKDNPNVQFMALNTWERKFKDFAAKLENAKKFIVENKYTFPVLIDEGSAVDQYDVDGIPTQFIIDKKGNIGFKNVGFEGPQMEDQLSLQIDILLNE